ncbi:hypothetical protein OB955_19705 [Halobacteria archaeon AArc-m2/3/4]|uniref:Uncharacterized protein n=1 Tax=Natronoglomus mannanivorans TaxID=2979990 RepID=A0AAP3E5B3_9EURY|nr:hypothetical protein [Halobacteria archaeon AArc-xg1-1]MCU4974949.1 hypothetical protein [Halobacteria archaeon AArc-m2/3/4]
MEPTPPSNSSDDPTTAFENDLGELILAAYGRGAAIEDTWKIDGPVSDAPNWRVTIEKVPPEDLTYDPTILEE